MLRNFLAILFIINCPGFAFSSPISNVEKVKINYKPLFCDKWSHYMYLDSIENDRLAKTLLSLKFYEKWGTRTIPLCINLKDYNSYTNLSQSVYFSSKRLEHIVENIPKFFFQLVRTDVNNKNEYYETFLFLVLGIFTFLLFFYSSERHKYLFRRKHSILMKPNLHDKSNFFKRIKSPNWPNAYLWCTIVFLILSLGSLLMQSLSEYLPSDNDLVAIQASTVAILFPLIILILQKNDGSSNVISSREVLLDRAWAFPISIILPLLSIYYILSGSPLWGSFIAVISICLTLYALISLLEITFSIEVWKKQEQDLLERKVDAIASEELANKVSQGMLTENLKNKFNHIRYEPHFSEILHVRKEKSKINNILAPNFGSIIAISISNLKKIEKIINEVDEKHDVKVILTKAPGDELIKSEETIGVIIYPKNNFPSEILTHINLLLVKSLILGKKKIPAKEVLKTLMSKLGKMGKSAVLTEDRENINLLKKTYIDIYKKIYESKERSNNFLKYSGDPMSFQYFGETSDPFDAMLRQISQLQEDTIKYDEVDSYLAHTAIYLPLPLCYEAIKNEDENAISRFIHLADSQFAFIKLYNAPISRFSDILDWLVSLIRFNLIYKIKDDVKSKKNFEKPLKYLQWALRELQAGFKYSLDLGYEQVAAEVLNRINKRVAIYENEIDLYQLDHQKRLIEYSQESNSDIKEINRLKSELQEVEKKYYIKERLKNWRLISAVAGANYALQIYEKNNCSNELKEASKNFFKLCINHLPSSFAEVFKLFIFYKREISIANWGWERWETHQPEIVYSPYTRQMIIRVFALLFYRASQELPADFAISNMNLTLSDTFELRDEGEIRKIITDTKTLPEFNFFDDKKDDDVKQLLDLLNNNFDLISKEADLADNLALVEKPIDEKLVNQYKVSLKEGLKEQQLFRSLCGYKDEQSLNKENNWFGTRSLIPRYFYVNQNTISIDDPGRSEGQSLGASENFQVFKILLESIDNSKFFTDIDEALREIHKMDIDKHRLAIFGSIKSLDKIKLIGNQKFVQRSHLTGDELGWHGLGYYIYANKEIPIYRLQDQNLKVKCGVIITTIENISVLTKTENQESLLSKATGWHFKLTDPRDDHKLRTDIYKQNPKWIENFPIEYRDKLIGKNLVAEYFTLLSAKFNDPRNVTAVLVPEEDNT